MFFKPLSHRVLIGRIICTFQRIANKPHLHCNVVYGDCRQIRGNAANSVNVQRSARFQNPFFILNADRIEIVRQILPDISRGPGKYVGFYAHAFCLLDKRRLKV